MGFTKKRSRSSGGQYCDFDEEEELSQLQGKLEGRASRSTARWEEDTGRRTLPDPAGQAGQSGDTVTGSEVQRKLRGQ
ncbi:hypothetical protein NDU88_005437 [Pleurodeles waltl]|uniref:Uncharacterized protein n=1 Tax=Pleurodeles waltl TaxID=8319 RepID=A0AAV7NMJ9_PLEWA|nr:hypothetical protein NDU88_005437 [Pleurodeles waltl]